MQPCVPFDFIQVAVCFHTAAVNNTGFYHTSVLLSTVIVMVLTVCPFYHMVVNSFGGLRPNPA